MTQPWCIRVCLLFICLCPSKSPLPIGDLPLPTGNLPWPVDDLPLLVALHHWHWPSAHRLFSFAFEVLVNHLWSCAKWMCPCTCHAGLCAHNPYPSAHQTCPSRPPMCQSALPLLPRYLISLGRPPSLDPTPMPMCPCNHLSTSSLCRS